MQIKDGSPVFRPPSEYQTSKVHFSDVSNIQMFVFQIPTVWHQFYPHNAILVTFLSTTSFLQNVCEKREKALLNHKWISLVNPQMSNNWKKSNCFFVGVDDAGLRVNPCPWWHVREIFKHEKSHNSIQAYDWGVLHDYFFDSTGQKFVQLFVLPYSFWIDLWSGRKGDDHDAQVVSASLKKS